MAETPALLGLGIGEGGIDTRRRGIVDALDGEIGLGDAMCCRRCHLLGHGDFPSSSGSVAVRNSPSASRRRSQIARSEEHTSEFQSLMRISYAAFCLKKQTHTHHM